LIDLPLCGNETRKRREEKRVAAPVRKRNLSAEKRQRQSLNNRLRNKAIRSRVKTFLKKVHEAINRRDGAAADAELRVCTSELYAAARKGVLARKTAARYVSRLSKRVHKLKSGLRT
jgi:small subunit ribosomal protein S20